MTQTNCCALVDLSIIIVNYRGWKHLENCLDALKNFGGEQFSFEVNVVDNCSNDGKLEGFQLRFPKFRFHLNGGNNGFSNGCNLGAKISEGEYFLFLNPDTIASEESVSGLLNVIRSNPDITILSCSQKNCRGNEESPYGFFPALFTLSGLLRAICQKAKKKELEGCFSPGKEIIYPDWVSGSVVMISKHKFDELGGWNEDYWLYYEDVDLCKRATDMGGTVALHNRISIIHNHGGTTRTNPRVTALTKSEVVISRHVYLSRHYSGLSAAGLHVVVMISVLLGTLLPALFGLLFFFIRRLNQYTHLYRRLLAYYFLVPFRGTWLSPRSVNNRK
ncbi:glycosyltransferase [Prolixibacter sp. SD074]|uniref:glycosyltransferase n=1 Tax=Prolixibacter sp. SD074 TaxID=2652391 RepID=UPI0018902F15|nr:glycosyltransferase [Prolixibacter sp. SD074]